jgi:hypothetical protein
VTVETGAGAASFWVVDVEPAGPAFTRVAIGIGEVRHAVEAWRSRGPSLCGVEEPLNGWRVVGRVYDVESIGCGPCCVVATRLRDEQLLMRDPVPGGNAARVGTTPPAGTKRWTS